MWLYAVWSVFGLLAAGYAGIKLFCPWLILDIHYMLRIVPCVAQYVKMLKRKTFVIEMFEETVKQHPNKNFLLFEDSAYTYKEANEYANKMARLALSLGLEKGSTIAFMQYNSPEFVWTFLGCLKLGIRISLINTNLRGKALLHCLSVSDTSSVIIGNDADLIAAVDGIISDIPDAVVYVQGSSSVSLPSRFISLESKHSDESSDSIDAEVRTGQKDTDACIYVFTSGTTGLPKAASVPHRRIMSSFIISGAIGLRPDDVIYITTPLYHSGALVAALCGAICHGAAIALARKFSTTSFWKDVRRHKASVFFYIGELCRYLLNNEKTDRDKDHFVRLAFGNGLRQDIFAEFKNRFDVPNIAEFYASTEGVAGFVNLLNVVGSCGRSSPILERVVPCGLYRWDVDKESLLRDKKGHCIRVEQGKPGLLLMQIIREQKFDGYRGSKELSESKIVRNVQKDGDAYFNTGDMMYKDKEYNVYFSDRIGDTFRWKGENVSTTEVSNLLTELDFVIDASVYGVNVPGHNGRAGMAALLIKPETIEITTKELTDLSRHCQEVLPVYAIPMFLRIKWEELDMTSTNKQTKVKLKQEGFDYFIIKDPLFYFDKSNKLYKILTKKVHEDIMNQTIKF